MVVENSSHSLPFVPMVLLYVPPALIYQGESGFDNYHRLTRSLVFFHARIIKLSRTYTWESVLILALTFHRERVVLGFNDKNVWQLPPALIDEHLRGSLKPAELSAPSTPSTYGSSAPRTTDPTTEYCFRWNTVPRLSASEIMPAFDAVKITSERITRTHPVRAMTITLGNLCC
jgi:hypothetical protein